MHPLLFHLGPLPIWSWSVFVGAGMVLAWLAIPRYGRLAGLGREETLNLFVITLVGGMAGAKLLHVLTRWSDVVAHPALAWEILVSGGVVYGGIVAGIACGAVYAWRRGFTFWKVVDVIAVPALIGQAVGRIGCLLSGCCFGGPTALPWGVRYDDPVAHELHADLPYGTVHPVQVYETLGAGVLALGLHRAWRGPYRPGRIGLLWLLSYGVVRTALETFRGDAVRGGLGPLSTSQVVGVAMIVVGACGLWLRRGTPVEPPLEKRRRHDAAPAAVAGAKGISGRKPALRRR